MPFTALTRSQLRARLQEKWEDVPFWSDTEANDVLNEALYWLNLYTGVWKRRVVQTTVADRVYYTLDSTLIYNARVEFNGVSLAQSSFRDLDDGRPGWEAETTDTAGAPDTPQLWLPVGMTTFAIWPADHDGQNSLLIDGVHATPVMDADDDTVDLDEASMEALIGEALFLASFKDPGRLVKTQPWHSAFLALCLSTNRRLNASDAFRQAAGLDTDREATPTAKGEDVA